MINLVNYQKMSVAERKDLFLRSLYTVPYFTKLLFEIAVGTKPQTQFSAKTQVNADFWLTSAYSNFSDVFQDAASFFNTTVYQGYRESWYNFDSGQKLPATQLFTQVRFDTPVANEIGVDKQFEPMPFFVPNGNQIYVEIENTAAKTATANAIVMLAGFQRDTANFIDTRTESLINASLSKPVTFEYFKFNVDSDGQQIHTLTNDNTPRLILAFGARNTTADKGKVSASNIEIRDVTRQKSWNNDPIPLQFFAPRLTCLLDTHLYWLPTEYFFVPKGNLRFDLSNDSPDAPDQGYEFIALTRTI